MPPRNQPSKAAKKAELTRASTRASSSANAAALAEPAPAPSPSSGDKRTRGKKPAKQSAVADEMDDEAEQARLKVDTKKASKQSLRQGFSKYSSDLLYWWGMDYDGWGVSVTDAANRDKVIDALVNMKAEVPKNEQEIIQTYKKLVRTDYKGEWKHAEEQQRRVAENESDEGDEEEEEEEPQELPNKRRKLSAASSAASSSSSSSSSLSSSLRCRFCQTPTDSGLCPHCGCSSMYEYNHDINVDLRHLHRSRLATAGTEQKTVHSSAAASASVESEKKETALSRRDKEWKRQTDEGEKFPRFKADPASYSVKKAFEDMRKSYYGANFVQPSDAMINLIQSGKLRAIGHAMPKSTKEELESDGRDNTEAKLSIDAKGLRVSESFSAPRVNSLTSFLKIVTGAIVPSLIMQPQALLDWIALTRSVILLNEQYGWDSAYSYFATALTNGVANRTPFGEVDMVSFNGMMAKMQVGNFGIQRSGADLDDNSSSSSSSAAASSSRPCRHYNSPRGCPFRSCRFLHICSNHNCPQPVGHNFIACPMKREWDGDSSSAKPSSASSYPSRSSGAPSGSRYSSSSKGGHDRHVTFNTKNDAPGKQ